MEKLKQQKFTYKLPTDIICEILKFVNPSIVYLEGESLINIEEDVFKVQSTGDFEDHVSVFLKPMDLPDVLTPYEFGGMMTHFSQTRIKRVIPLNLFPLCRIKNSFGNVVKRVFKQKEWESKVNMERRLVRYEKFKNARKRLKWKAIIRILSFVEPSKTYVGSYLIRYRNVVEPEKIEIFRGNEEYKNKVTKERNFQLPKELGENPRVGSAGIQIECIDTIPKNLKPIDRMWQHSVTLVFKNMEWEMDNEDSYFDDKIY